MVTHIFLIVTGVNPLEILLQTMAEEPDLCSAISIPEFRHMLEVLLQKYMLDEPLQIPSPYGRLLNKVLAKNPLADSLAVPDFLNEVLEADDLKM